MGDVQIFLAKLISI